MMESVNLTGATLIEAQLGGTSFSDCNLSNIVIKLANARRTFFRNTIMPHGTIRTDD